ncbi:hypothetical protein [Bacteroides sp. 51]|uniref:hypothetical protein n=1 Tax=Bacteroides sp. 51 TaxID=2302938 RepID=UPI0013D45AB8|nr:hypothetical protein [Bacteroides sp. 51]NDV80873.1 hypothetical protein [Bacteroides sp. 51]
MYRRFLNTNDYYGIITQEALSQLLRNAPERILQAEESAEMSIVEYLSENYEIENELRKGKYIAQYERSITYPVGAHLYYEENIYEVIRSLSGYKAPSDMCYWEEYSDLVNKIQEVKPYSQFGTYYKDDIVFYNGLAFICVEDHGYKFGNIRIPLVNGWEIVEFSEWLPIDYKLWDVVIYESNFYTLISEEGFDNSINPFDSNNWGAIADYNPEYNDYELSSHEYIVYNGVVFRPEIDVNADIPKIGTNLSSGDPRNYNLKKHFVRLSLYELTKLIAPNNVSIVRIKDYEESMKWLSDAAKLKLNPQIPRKVIDEHRPVMDWQMATFQNDYDPYKNPWLI